MSINTNNLQSNRRSQLNKYFNLWRENPKLDSDDEKIIIQLLTELNKSIYCDTHENEIYLIITKLDQDALESYYKITSDTNRIDRLKQKLEFLLKYTPSDIIKNYRDLWTGHSFLSFLSVCTLLSDEYYEYLCKKFIEIGIDTNIIAFDPDNFCSIYFKYSFLSGAVLRLNIDFVKLALSNDNHRTDDTVSYEFSDSYKKQGDNDSRYFGNDPNSSIYNGLEDNIAMYVLRKYKDPSNLQIIEKVIIIIDMLINAKIKLNLDYLNHSNESLLDICNISGWADKLVPKIIAENQTFEDYLISKGCKYNNLKNSNIQILSKVCYHIDILKEFKDPGYKIKSQLKKILRDWITNNNIKKEETEYFVKIVSFVSMNLMNIPDYEDKSLHGIEKLYIQLEMFQIPNILGSNYCTFEKNFIPNEKIFNFILNHIPHNLIINSRDIWTGDSLLTALINPEHMNLDTVDNYEYWCNKFIDMGIDTNIIASEPDPFNKVYYYNWSFLSGAIMRLNVDFVKLALSNDKHRTDDTVSYGFSDSYKKQGDNNSRYLGNDPNQYHCASDYNIAMELLSKYKNPSDPKIIEKVIIIIDLLINAKNKLDLSYTKEPKYIWLNNGETLLDICHSTGWDDKIVPKIIAENQTFVDYLISKGCQYNKIGKNESKQILSVICYCIDNQLKIYDPNSKFDGQLNKLFAYWIEQKNLTEEETEYFIKIVRFVNTNYMCSEQIPCTQLEMFTISNILFSPCNHDKKEKNNKDNFDFWLKYIPFELIINYK
jgi:hypothetical protein